MLEIGKAVNMELSERESKKKQNKTKQNKTKHMERQGSCIEKKKSFLFVFLAVSFIIDHFNPL